MVRYFYKHIFSAWIFHSNVPNNSSHLFFFYWDNIWKSLRKSEGVRESAINEAEGKRQAEILASEAMQQRLINEAEGQAQSVIINANAKVCSF